MFVLGRHMIAALTITVVSLIVGDAQSVPFCASAVGPNTVLCEDFSGINPLAGFTVLTPLGGSQSAMNVTVDNEQLLFEHIGGFGVAHTVTTTPLVLNNKSLEANVFFDGPNARANAGILWRDTSAANSLFFGLQQDENRAILDTIVGGVFTRYDAPIIVGLGQFYHLTLRTTMVGGIQAFVDGTLIINVGLFDVMSLPVSMNAGFGGNSRSGLDLRYDNLLITTIPLPPALVLFGAALGLLSFAGRHRFFRK